MHRRNHDNSLNGQRAVLFDFDGTMGRTLPTWATAYRTALRHYGVELDEEQAIKCCFHTSGSEAARAHNISDPKEFKERVWNEVRAQITTSEPYPHLVETLKLITSHGIKTAVVTNSRAGVVMPVLERWGIETLFHSVITIEAVTHGKPDPEMIHYAVNTLNSSPSHTYIIGDSTADLIAGARAGIKTVAFSPPENHRFHNPSILREANPSHLIAALPDLRALLALSEAHKEEA